MSLFDWLRRPSADPEDVPSEPRDLKINEINRMFRNTECAFCASGLVQGPRGGAGMYVLCKDNHHEFFWIEGGWPIAARYLGVASSSEGLAKFGIKQEEAA